jgi:hypothetical protein
MNPNQEPWRIQAADQLWGAGQQLLDAVLDSVREIEPQLYMNANTDPSVVFDYLKQMMKDAHRMNGEHAVAMTTVICAAALTRLARAPLATHDPLARLEEELNNDDH